LLLTSEITDIDFEDFIDDNSDDIQMTIINPDGSETLRTFSSLEDFYDVYNPEDYDPDGTLSDVYYNDNGTIKEEYINNDGTIKMGRERQTVDFNMAAKAYNDKLGVSDPLGFGYKEYLGKS
jgi:hypothetical protein